LERAEAALRARSARRRPEDAAAALSAADWSGENPRAGSKAHRQCPERPIIDEAVIAALGYVVEVLNADDSVIACASAIVERRPC